MFKSLKTKKRRSLCWAILFSFVSLFPVSGMAQNTILSDDGDAPEARTYSEGSLVYNRNVPESAQYVTLCLPFPTVKSYMSGVSEVYRFSGYALNHSGKLTLLLQKDVDENAEIAAGTPVFLKLDGVSVFSASISKEFDVTNVEPETQKITVFDFVDENTLTVENTQLDVRYGGTYVRHDDIENSMTFNYNGTFGPSSYVQKYRAYVTKANAAAQSALRSVDISVVDGGTTGIEALLRNSAIVNAPSQADNNVYTLDGRLVNEKNIGKGVYIKKHKKFVVK